MKALWDELNAKSNEMAEQVSRDEIRSGETADVSCYIYLLCFQKRSGNMALRKKIKALPSLFVYPTTASGTQQLENKLKPEDNVRHSLTGRNKNCTHHSVRTNGVALREMAQRNVEWYSVHKNSVALCEMAQRNVEWYSVHANSVALREMV
ncbi:hypothetical protein pdam_00024861 [Pocillopora damicornis]|uniref:Uncharacterized protein n=1 Tax=Pocillopora damicornis TaxID=46731 RepID=A0A3M6UNW7_POCDA|nr:hypothetical protein pdam_00024861 [Pocillopora damicornis]